jgi:lipoyl synthase
MEPIQIRDSTVSSAAVRGGKPAWIKVRLPRSEAYANLKKMLRKSNLHTVCEEAACPNIFECFSKNVATFMIMGDTCTRYCHYCHVKTGKPKELDIDEPQKIADAIAKLGLMYVVLTCVTRDDLADGGAGHFAACVAAINKKIPDCKVEILTSDFAYSFDSLKIAVHGHPDVFSHNIEAPRRVYRHVRRQGTYEDSLRLLHNVKRIDPHMATKSGLMLGLGETDEEVFQCMADLRMVGVDFLTLGQYLQPTTRHATVMRWYTPEEFESFAQLGRKMGFAHVEAGPLVRSSYRADKLHSRV